MKTLRLFIILFGLTITTYSQSYNCKGDHKINIGYDLYGYGNGIKVTYDHGLGELFSIGVGASYFFNNDDDTDYFLFGRTAFHLGPLFDFPSKFDIYPGIDIGYLSRNDIGFAGYLGVRYFFSDKLGIFTELGNTGSVGVSLNL